MISKLHTHTATGHFNGQDRLRQGDKLGTNTYFCILTLRKTWLRKRVTKYLEPRSVPAYHTGTRGLLRLGSRGRDCHRRPCARSEEASALSFARTAGTGQVLSKRCAVRTCHLAAHCYQLCPVGRLRDSPGHRWESWEIGNVFWLRRGVPRTEH